MCQIKSAMTSYPMKIAMIIAGLTFAQTRSNLTKTKQSNFSVVKQCKSKKKVKI